MASKQAMFGFYGTFHQSIQHHDADAVHNLHSEAPTCTSHFLYMRVGMGFQALNFGCRPII